MKNLSRILTETVIRKAINELKDSPERKSRNLVDMALNFTEGQYLRDFLFKVQKILQDENSPYYRLVIDAINHIDTERLVSFGMNIGFNTVTLGSPKIRKTEKEECFDIPWTLFLDLKKYQKNRDKSKYTVLLKEGVEMGIYCYHVSIGENLFEVLDLISEHKDIAFILFLKPSDITEELIQKTNNINNIMLTVKAADNSDEACKLLRRSNMLYSVYYIYDKNDEELILSDELFTYATELRPLFTALIPGNGCDKELIYNIYSYIKETRVERSFLTIPWDIVNDTRYIDGKISDNVCSAGIDENGNTIKLTDGYVQTKFNVFESSLFEALKSTLPRK